MSNESKNELLKQATTLSELFSVEVTIKLFGRVVFRYTYPPKKDSGK